MYVSYNLRLDNIMCDFAKRRLGNTMHNIEPHNVPQLNKRTMRTEYVLIPT